MSTPFRSIHVATVASRLALAFTLLLTPVFAWQAGAAESDVPLQLGSEQIGMTSEGIAEATQAASVERAVADATVESEWTDADLGEGHIVLECPEPVVATTANASGPVVATHARGVEDYESCVEVAIRSGNGFKASSGVCRTLYPESPKLPAVGAGPPPSEPQAKAAVSDDVWDAAAADAPPPAAEPTLQATPTQY